MDVRNYLQVISRHRWLIALLLVIGLAGGVGTHFLTERTYSATSTVLLKPNDPAERVTEAPGGYFDPDRYNSAQVGVMTSPEVAQIAAAQLGGGTTAEDVRSALDVQTGNSSDLVTVTAAADDPRRAADIANALSRAYIEYNRTTEVAALQAAAAGIQTQLDELEDRLATLRAGGADETDSSVQALNEQYSTSYGKQQDLLIDASLKKGEAQVVSPAEAPASAEGLSMASKAVLGGLLGLVLGLALAFLRDQLDDRLRSSDEVPGLTGLPVLAELPVDRRTAKEPRTLAVQVDSRGLLAESVRGLRSNLLFLSLDKPVKRLLISSALPGEGKSSVSANLAATYAQAGFRTVVVSADLRRPGLEKILLEGQQGPGLTGTLTSVMPYFRLNGGTRATERRELMARTLDQAIVSTAVPGLSLLPAGNRPTNPAELLSSSAMDDLFALLDERFDLVIVDTPPLLAVTDAAVLAPKVGAVVMVTSLQDARRRSLRRSVEALQNAHADLLGIVVNRSAGSEKVVAYYGDDEPREEIAAPRPVTRDAGSSGDLLPQERR